MITSPWIELSSHRSTSFVFHSETWLSLVSMVFYRTSHVLCTMNCAILDKVEGLDLEMDVEIMVTDFEEGVLCAVAGVVG